MPLLQHAGKDCTDDFFGLHKQSDLKKWGERFAIGTVSHVSIETKNTEHEGSMPYAEPMSMYETEGHVRFKHAVRGIMEFLLRPMVESDDGNPVSLELLEKIGQTGLFACFMGPGEHLRDVPELPGNLDPELFDHLHERICEEEIGRLGSLGKQACLVNSIISTTVAVKDAVFGGLVVGLPLLLQFGKKGLISKVAPSVLQGRKQICLAITEPYVSLKYRT